MFRIADAEPIAVALPLLRPVSMSGETVSEARNLIVRMTDGEGHVGWGEAASAPTMTGETQPGMMAVARAAIAQLIGREVASVAEISRQVASTVQGSSGVKTALETALLDIAGRRAGQPIYEIIGGRVRNRATIVKLLAADGQDSETEQVLRARDSGIRAFKVKVGICGVEFDLSRCRVVRDAAGTEARVSADANGGFDEEGAIAFCEGAGDAGLDFVEQPVPPDSLVAMRACAAASTVPVGADEGIRTVADIRAHHAMQAASGGSLKPLKLGIWNLMAAGELMNRLGMHVNLAGKVAESSIGSAAVAHLAMAVPQLDWDASITNQYLAADVAVRPIEAVDGTISAIEAPGLGIDVDLGKLDGMRLH